MYQCTIEHHTHVAEVPDPHRRVFGVLERCDSEALCFAEFCSGFVTEIYADCNDQRISAAEGRIEARDSLEGSGRLRLLPQGQRTHQDIHGCHQCPGQAIPPHLGPLAFAERQRGPRQGHRADPRLPQRGHASSASKNRQRASYAVRGHTGL